jgi:hypothetical protein
VELTATVDLLRERIKDTAEDIRYKVSPAGIKSEATTYLSQKGKGWLESLKQRAMDNPIQTIAIGTAAVAPLVRLARGMPMPLLLMAAGLAISSKSVREQASNLAGPFVEPARDLASEASSRAQTAGQALKEAAAGALEQVTSKATDVGNTASDRLDELQDQADRGRAGLGDNVAAGAQAAKETMEQVRAKAGDALSSAPDAARETIRENLVLVGSLGVAIGAILAASLPTSRAESAVLGRSSSKVKKAAAAAAQSGFETAKDAAFSAAEAGMRKVAEADLGSHASRMTEEAADTLKTVTEDVITTAFEPSHDNHPEFDRGNHE